MTGAKPFGTPPIDRYWPYRSCGVGSHWLSGLPVGPSADV